MTAVGSLTIGTTSKMTQIVTKTIGIHSDTYNNKKANENNCIRKIF